MLAPKPITWEDYSVWSKKGLCWESSDSYWADENDDKKLPDKYAITCGRCPVKALCLDFALNTEAPDGECGVWGGTTAFQRQQLKREMSRKGCPGCGSDAVIAQHAGEICISCGLSWLV